MVGCTALSSLLKTSRAASSYRVAASCTGLTSLDVWACSKFSDEAIKAIAAGCTALISLDVSSCSQLTGESIKAVTAGCTALTSLSASDTLSGDKLVTGVPS